MAHRSMQLQPTTLTSAEDLEREVADIAAMNVEQLRALAEDSRAASAKGTFERSDRSRSLIPDPRSGARRIEPGSAADFAVGYDERGRASAEDQSRIGSGARVRRCAPRSGGRARRLPLAGRDV